MINSREMLTNEDASPALLMHILDRELKDSWKEWEPEVLWDEIKERIGVDLEKYPRGIRDRIMALRVLIKTNTPWQDWHPFLVTALALNGIEPDVETAQTVSPSYMAYAVSVMRRIESENEFDQDVRYMMAAILNSQGIYWVPPWPLGDVIWAEMEYFQDNDDKAAFADLARVDYVSSDENTDFDIEHPVRMHTVKLKAINEFLQQREEAEKEVI